MVPAFVRSVAPSRHWTRRCGRLDGTRVAVDSAIDGLNAVRIFDLDGRVTIVQTQEPGSRTEGSGRCNGGPTASS